MRLDSSNRCTTADTIAWTGASVVTVGTRHVKIWRLEQPSSPSKSRRVLDNAHDGSTASPVPKTFAGRNCVLGPLKDATFTCVVGISEDRAVLGTQDGAICILDDANRTQNLYQVSKEDHCITCITVDRSSGVVWLGGEGVEPKALSLDVLLTVDGPSASPQARDGLGKQVKEKKGGTPYTLAICCVGNRLVAMDSSRVMRIYDIEPTTTDSPRISSIQQLAAHDKPVLGAVILSKPNANESDFLTFSENGDVLHWLWDGTCKSRCLVSLDHSLACAIEEANGLRVVLASSQSAMLFAGDKAGLLQYV